MNMSSNISLNYKSSHNLTHPIYHGGLGTQVGFAIIAFLCIVGNFLVFLLFLHTEKLRRCSHGILIWNLSIVDFLTGIFVIVTPEHIIREAFIHPPPGLAGQLFCMIIGSEIFTFGFGFTSMYTLCVLSIERRYGVVKSRCHAIYFNTRRTKWMVVGVWIWGMLLVTMNIFQSHYVIDENPPCVWRSLPGGPEINMAVYFILFFFRFLLPMICVIACYVDIWRYMRSMVRDLQRVMNKKMLASYRAKKRVTVTCAVASLAFILCWLPNVIYFTLANVGVVTIANDAHFITKLLVLINSCINPFIYACTNSNYRKEFINMLIDWKCISKKTHLVDNSQYSNTQYENCMITVNK